MENIEFTKLRLVPNDISCKMCFKIQQDRNNNTEQIDIIDSSTEEIIHSFEENRIGTSLISFLNNYGKIIDEFDKYINKYKNLAKFEFENLYTYMKELEMSLLKIFDEARIISITLREFLCDMRYDFEKETYNFNLEEYHAGLTNNRTDFKEMISHYSSIRNYRNYEDNDTFYKNIWIGFLEKYKRLLKDLKENLDISFVSKDDKRNYAKKFTGTPTILPSTEVFYNENENSNYLEPIEYRYCINNFSNLIYSSLHCVFLSKKAIAKCKKCDKYFITCEDNKEIYCPNLDENGFYTMVKESIEDVENEKGYKLVVDSDCRRKAQEECTRNPVTAKKSKFKDKRIMNIKGKIMDRLSRKGKDGTLLYGDLKEKFEKEFDEKVEELFSKYPDNQEKREDEMLKFMNLKNKEYRKQN